MSSVKSTRKHVFRRKPKLVYADNVKRETDKEVCKIVVLSQGEADFCCNETISKLRQGDIVIINGGTEYDISLSENADASFIAIDNLHVATLSLNKLSNEPFTIIKAISSIKQITSLAYSLIAEKPDSPLYETVTQSTIIALISVILRLNDNETVLYSERANFDKVKTYFDENFTKITSVQQVCETLGVNRFYLSKVFNEQTGLPPNKYLILKRVKKAEELLETTELDVNDVAKQCGYKDPAFFCRTFKKQRGITPLRHRYLFKLNSNDEN